MLIAERQKALYLNRRANPNPVIHDLPKTGAFVPWCLDLSEPWRSGVDLRDKLAILRHLNIPLIPVRYRLETYICLSQTNHLNN
jgi:hypothetical protein